MVIEAKSAEDGFHDLVRISTQLHVALVALCKGEALTVVKNSIEGHALGEWRRLYR